MKILQFEMIGGASGDMILGALIELGADAKRLQQELSSLPIEPFEIEATPFQSDKIHGTQVAVRVHEHPHHHATESPGHPEDHHGEQAPATREGL